MTKAEWIIYGGLLAVVVLAIIRRLLLDVRRNSRQRQTCGWLPDHVGGPGHNQALDPDQEPGGK